jgi:hypothetical protein
MGSRVSPEAQAATAQDVVAFVVLTSEPGTNGSPPHAQIRIEEVLRGNLKCGTLTAYFPGPADAAFYVARGAGFGEAGDAAIAKWNAEVRHGPAVGTRLVGVVHAQENGGVVVDLYACWPDDEDRRARLRGAH